MDKIALIKAEIERLKSTNPSEYNYQNAEGYTWALDDLLSFIDNLSEEEPDTDLEKEIEKEWEKLEKDYSPSALDKSHIIVSGLVGRKQFSRIAHHFYELCKNSK